jgi:hypothetical protein
VKIFTIQKVDDSDFPKQYTKILIIASKYEINFQRNPIISKNPKIIFMIESLIDYFENKLKKVDFEFWDRLKN